MPVHALIVAVQAYQILVRPHLIGHCIFHPTCSEYAVDALQSHGAFRGVILTIRRGCRCRPLARGGFDPVPENHTCRHCSSE
ncbi:MAG: membrane protein insertion efficiency factor YidD [Planctomycetes bacterium]|nr:membrane protein insertion efficiency factor YidD [Planctomycetota bacterium]MBI3834456.1 membrane protein insertion efficiency factor YidD [Planctomycetota bacterium]